MNIKDREVTEVLNELEALHEMSKGLRGKAMMPKLAAYLGKPSTRPSEWIVGRQRMPSLASFQVLKAFLGLAKRDIVTPQMKADFKRKLKAVRSKRGFNSN